MDAMRLRKMLVSGRAKRRGHLPRFRASVEGAGRPWHVIIFMVITLLIGGSSRADVASLILLRPLAMLLMVYAMITLPVMAWRDNRIIIGIAGAIVLLPALQLVPLPPTWWQALPGREFVTKIDETVGIFNAWRPLTLSLAGTWNALFSLSIPLAMLFMGLRLDGEQRRQLVPLMLFLILASAALGLLQIIGPHGGPLYLYPVTHSDSPVGLLANRNHQATFVACAFPILAYLLTDAEFSRKTYGQPWFTALVAMFLLPFVLIAGSRAGLVVACLAIGLAAILYFVGLRERGELVNRRVILGVGGAAALVGVMTLVAVGLGRAEALRRALGWEFESDARLSAWSVIREFTGDYWPWGTGMGSFAEVYKVYEPDSMLQPSYFNQAHNDWLEIVLTGGAPAAILLIIVVGIWGWRAWQVRRKRPSHQLSRLGLAVIMLFALASVTDYPLRVPSMMAFLSIAVLWTLPFKHSCRSEGR